MSQVNTNTLGDAAGANTVPIADVINGSARAWVNFNGTGTVAIRADYNVDSITDNGVGDYTINVTNDLTDTNYAVVGSARQTASARNFIPTDDTVKTISAFSVSTVTIGSSPGASDAAYVHVAVFR